MSFQHLSTRFSPNGRFPRPREWSENQPDLLRNYATAGGLQILRVSEESGRSGLRPDGREALQHVTRIPTDRIRVPEPLMRNRRSFEEMVKNVAKID